VVHVAGRRLAALAGRVGGGAEAAAVGGAELTVSRISNSASSVSSSSAPHAPAAGAGSAVTASAGDGAPAVSSGRGGGRYPCPAEVPR
jgi:hypothetical protein